MQNCTIGNSQITFQIVHKNVENILFCWRISNERKYFLAQDKFRQVGFYVVIIVHESEFEHTKQNDRSEIDFRSLLKTLYFAEVTDVVELIWYSEMEMLKTYQLRIWKRKFGKIGFGYFYT